jgi:PAS domain S-box-containing protein
MSFPTLSPMWHKLTEPHPSIEDIERRRQSRLLANFILVVLLFQILSLTLALSGNLPASGVGNIIIVIFVGTAVYLLNRNAHYILAAHLLIFTAFVITHLALITESHATIFYSAVMVLVSAMLLSLQVTLGYLIASIILQLIFVISVPQMFEIKSFQPLLYTILAGIVIFVYTRFRLDLERERQTELRQTIVALRKSEARWRSLVENAPDYIIELDPDLRIRYINRTQGAISPDEIIGKSVFDFLPVEDHSRVRELMLTVTQSLETHVHEGQGYTPEGVKSWYSTSITPIIREGQSDGLMLMSRDVSEHVQAEQHRLELSMAQDRVRLIEDLIGDLSHDLKTPLTIINTSLYLLEKLVDPQQQQNKIDQIKQQTLRLAKIIQDILTLSVLDKAPRLNLTTLNINQLVTEVGALLRPMAETKGVDLKLELQPNIISVQADEEALRRALTNLVENALNYTSAPGEVTVITVQDQDRVTVDVCDTGIGIATEELALIFERFYRTSKAREALTGGTGLGLAIVKKTVEMHGGEIEVSSRVGIGTTFRVSLPTTP